MSNQLPVKIYYEDTDAGGVVYHANYIKFCERGRTELLNACGYKNSDLAEKLDVMFVVRHIDADYLKPAFLEDELTLTTTIKAMKNSSLIMQQILTKGDNTIFKADITLVCVTQNPVKPTKIPPVIRKAFLEHIN